MPSDSTNSPADPLAVLSTPDERRRPRARFAIELRQRLEEAAVSDESDNRTAGRRAAEGRAVTPYTGGVSNLFYFTLPAPDLDRSKAFFGRVLGWEVAGGSLGGHVANVTPSGGLWPGGAANEQSVFIVVDDIEEAAAKVVELGGVVEGPISGGAPGRFVSCRDDQGTQFHLQAAGEGEYLEYARNPVKGSSHGDLFYFSLPVADGERARRFYGELFGWELTEPGQQGGMNAHNLIIDGGVQAGKDGDRVQLWFRVDDLAAAIDVIRDLGGDATDIEDTPEGRISYCHDDQGVAFGLAEPAPGF